MPSNVNNTNLDLRKDQLKQNLLHEVTRTTNTITTTTTTKECLQNSDTNTHTTGSIGPLTSTGTSFVTSMDDTVIDMEVDSVDEDSTYISNYVSLHFVFNYMLYFYLPQMSSIQPYKVI